MAGGDLGEWRPLGLTEAVAAFRDASVRWWIGGGRALALHLGREWRVHEDTDVGVRRADVPALRALLAGWDVHVAAAGRLRRWRGEALGAGRHENNLWCRRVAGGPWELDVTIGEGTTGEWIYRRDPSIRMAWPDAVLETPAGVPYLAPELQLLFKSKAPRPRDDEDAAVVIPALDAARRSRLAILLPAAHPWQRLARLRS